MNIINKYPKNLDLLIFFESEPFFTNELDHHYGYSYMDDLGLKVLFSFAALEGWIQTIIELNDTVISQHLSEGVIDFEIKNEIKGDYLSAKINLGEIVTQMELRLKPNISIKWNTLVE